ncbi:MAG: YihY/virulence factor BrkB family protein, partial [Bacteroidota bacterium]
MVFIRFYWDVLKKTFSDFFGLGMFTNAAALAYYTIFSLPPMLLVMLYSVNAFYSKAEFEAAMFEQIGGLIGNESAAQLSSTVSRLGLFDDNWWSIVIGAGTLVFTSTTVFITIQESLNKIFRVKAKPTGWGILKMLKDRLLSFAFVLGIAFVMLVSLSLNALLAAFNTYLSKMLPDLSIAFMTLMSILLPLFITTLLFMVIFKYLPDAKMKWKHCLAGGIFTTILFSLGKNLIGFYIGNSQTANLYEAAGSVMIILLWVFYASTIFLLGASFTANWVRSLQGNIPPSKYAVKVVQQEVEVSKEKAAEIV